MSDTSVIYKYELAVTDEQEVLMPKAAEILCAQEQNGRLCVWAQVFPEQEMRPRKFYVHGTGIHGLIHGRYIDSVQMSGNFVWHVYEDMSWRNSL